MRTTTPDTISRLILKRLATSETRTLALTVAVRNDLAAHGGYGGDLSKAIKLALGRLIRAKRITDADGSYSLSRHASAAHAHT